LDLTDETFGVGEPFFSPDLSEEAEADSPPIKRALEIENVDFDLQAATAESGPAADIR
jgi:hypothetical protein